MPAVLQNLRDFPRHYCGGHFLVFEQSPEDELHDRGYMGFRIIKNAIQKRSLWNSFRSKAGQPRFLAVPPKALEEARRLFPALENLERLQALKKKAGGKSPLEALPTRLPTRLPLQKAKAKPKASFPGPDAVRPALFPLKQNKPIFSLHLRAPPNPLSSNFQDARSPPALKSRWLSLFRSPCCVSCPVPS